MQQSKKKTYKIFQHINEIYRTKNIIQPQKHDFWPMWINIIAQVYENQPKPFKW